MCDFFDDFEDFDNSDFTDEDNLEEDLEMDDPFAGDTEPEDGTDEAESKDDDFTAKDAFILGGALGWGYEEGLRERKRKKRKKFSDDSE